MIGLVIGTDPGGFENVMFEPNIESIRKDLARLVDAITIQKAVVQRSYDFGRPGPTRMAKIARLRDLEFSLAEYLGRPYVKKHHPDSFTNNNH